MKSRRKNLIGNLIGIGILTYSFGTILGMESNIQPFYSGKLNLVSFQEYVKIGEEQQGKGIGTYLLAAWTYPGARLGAAIHNLGIEDKLLN